MSYSVGREIVVNGSPVTIDPAFEKLFPRKQKDIDAIAEDMKVNGFNMAFPLLLADIGTEDKVYLLDGHTRVLAAKIAGVKLTSYSVMKFSTHQDAIDYAIHIQRDRRNLTDADIASCLDALDNVMTRGGDVKSLDYKKSKAPDGANDSKVKSATETAKKLGISTRKVERARAVLKDDTVKEAVMSGEKTINAAYNEIRGAKKPVTEEMRMVSIPIDSPYELTEIIREHYRPDQIAMIINILQRRMAA